MKRWFLITIFPLSTIAHDISLVGRLREIGFFCGKETRVFDTFENHKSQVHFLVQGANRFVVKQMISEDIKKQFCLIREALASCIAESLDIPVNHIRIIPPGARFPGKKFTERAATLHTFAHGRSLLDPGKYRYLKIKQLWKEALPKEHWGLTWQVIHNMSLHPDLPIIVAFDTFIGNSDRCPHNLRYHGKSDHFCGIDMEISFNKNLSNIAVDQIRRLLKSATRLSHKELMGLETYLIMLRNI